MAPGVTHPRLTAAQRAALNCDEISWLGWDVKGRPVVDGLYHNGMLQNRWLPHSKSVTCVWAILRNGQRVSPAHPIRFFDQAERERYERSTR